MTGAGVDAACCDFSFREAFSARWGDGPGLQLLREGAQRAVLHICQPSTLVVPSQCLGQALWQLLGFFLGWKGYKGKGRARGGEIKFNGSVFPTAKKVTYELQI